MNSPAMEILKILPFPLGFVYGVWFSYSFILSFSNSLFLNSAIAWHTWDLSFIAYRIQTLKGKCKHPNVMWFNVNCQLQLFIQIQAFWTCGLSEISSPSLENRLDLKMRQNEGIPEWRCCPLPLNLVISHQWICSVFHSLRGNEASLILRRVSRIAGDFGCRQSVVPMCLESLSLGRNVMHKWYFWTKLGSVRNISR